MPIIPEEEEFEMDQFVNWDHADPATGNAPFRDMDLGTNLMTQPATAEDGHDLDLALANVDGDNFSFWALQHFENSALATLNPTVDLAPPMADQDDGVTTAFADSFGVPSAPCSRCQRGGYQCKTIREGAYKGYCTSCVALRCACSFGLASENERPTDSAFPYNPWPRMGDHPEVILQEDAIQESHVSSHNTSAADLPGLVSLVEAEKEVPQRTPSNPKVGARFSRESARILKNWLSTHNRHPYPNEDEKEMLQKQTGLNKTQITNWLANARRRGKINPPRSTSPGIRTFSNAVEIPARRGTPSTFEQMNPLQRWQNSPPEHEPALATDIARAVTASRSTSSPSLNSPYLQNFTDDGSSRSLCAASSASSLGTSHGTTHSSAGSFVSVYSHGSKSSFGSMGSSLNRGRRRRRRRALPSRPNEKTPLSAPLKTYQCTFCTETFRTKHDWQRHEKSLHLSLERWVCAPDGPRAINPENGQLSCIFCAEPHPDDEHCETHNHSACLERSLEERTFYRKDHLRQHLKLVHGSKFVDWSMNAWKVSSPEIRSRCGFCGVVMDTWTFRVDHLAEHFKTGYSMADWKGDWGFEAPVLQMVENSIPPYLIDHERKSPYPFEATQGSPETPRNGFELVKSELLFYLYTKHDLVQSAKGVSDEELQFEAARIVYGADVRSQDSIASAPSWLRDLILSNQTVSEKARLAPIKSSIDSRQPRLQINGKNNIFQEDTMEAELQEYVKSRQMLGLTAMDHELQLEACRIVGRMEESSSHPSELVANFLLRLIHGSTGWLESFRQRAVLPRSEDVGDEAKRSSDLSKVDSTIHNYSRLETELAEFVREQRSRGIEPTDSDLQRQARIIIYEYDDNWNQTAADNQQWLNAFKHRHISVDASIATMNSHSPLTIASVTQSSSISPQAILSPAPLLAAQGLESDMYVNGGLANNTGMSLRFLNSANCYRRLAKELGRFVALTTSVNNPNRHVPTDDELQHQARWILYDSDDPWNQTAADNAEWLQRFKRETGILTDPSLPGLPEAYPWSLATPRTNLSSENGTAHTTTDVSGLDLVQSMSPSWGSSTAIFSCRELEEGLIDYVSGEVALLGEIGFPSNAMLKQKAREILQLSSTAADNDALLDGFVRMARNRLGLAVPQADQTSLPGLAMDPMQMSALPLEMDMGITDSEIKDILQDMEFDFGDTMGGGALLSEE